MSKLLEERPLIILPSLARRIGLNEAVVLQQLHFILRHIDSRVVELPGGRWCKASMGYWCEQFPFWSEATIKRTFQNLRQLKLISTQRGREANVYTINYPNITELLGQFDPWGGQDRSGGPAQNDLRIKEEDVQGEVRETTTGVAETATADGSPTLPGLEPPPPPKAATPDQDPLVGELWEHYFATFGDRLRVKELTPPRARSFKKGLTATGDDAELCKAAITGLKSYRDQHPDGSQDVSPSVIFETGPHSGRSLTDQIEWWASQADSGNSGDGPAKSSVLHARVSDRQLQVVQMYQRPDNGSLRERGEQALAWLRERYGMEPVVEGGQVTGWRKVEA